MVGPDHQASIEPAELKEMVAAIRQTEKALGDGKKLPSASERKNIDVVRKSIVAATKIRKGELFSKSNLSAKRPGTGITPMKINELFGKRSSRDYAPDDLIVGEL